jgi:hypothetical protein
LTDKVVSDIFIQSSLVIQANMKTTKIFDITEKARIYHMLAQMSSSFSSIIRYCADLEQAGALTPRAKNRFQAFTVEVQGELNLEILEHMDGIEMEDWARAGRVRAKWEKYLRGEPEPFGRKKAHKAQKPAPQERTRSSGASLK